MVPAIIVAEKRGKMKPVLLSAIGAYPDRPIVVWDGAAYHMKRQFYLGHYTAI